MNQHASRNEVDQTRVSLAPLTDTALVEAVRKLRSGVDVDESFRELELWARPRLLGYFQGHRFSPEDAEDLVQKTLIRVYLGVRQLEQEQKFLSWLFVIARNVRCTAIEHRQRERQAVAGGIELAENLPDQRAWQQSHREQLDQARLDEVRLAIEDLPAQQRQCLLLRVRDEMPYGEIAETLQLSVNTVRNHLAEAKKNLRRALKQLDTAL